MNQDTVSLDNHLLGTSEQLLKLTDSAHNRDVTCHMAAQAKHRIRIFNQRLDKRIYDQSGFIEACKQLALRSRSSRIEIIVTEPRQLSGPGHRLLNLAQQLSSYFEIRDAGRPFDSALHTFTTIDESGYIYRKNFERYEGAANYYDKPYTRELNQKFDEMWQQSRTNAELRRLSL